MPGWLSTSTGAAPSSRMGLTTDANVYVGAMTLSAPAYVDEHQRREQRESTVADCNDPRVAYEASERRLEGVYHGRARVLSSRTCRRRHSSV